MFLRVRSWNIKRVKPIFLVANLRKTSSALKQNNQQTLVYAPRWFNFFNLVGLLVLTCIITPVLFVMFTIELVIWLGGVIIPAINTSAYNTHLMVFIMHIVMIVLLDATLFHPSLNYLFLVSVLPSLLLSAFTLLNAFISFWFRFVFLFHFVRWLFLIGPY